MTNEQMDALLAYDESALVDHWRRQLGDASRDAVAGLVRRLEVTVPYVYTKLKSIKLQGNESLLTYLDVRALVLDQRRYAEGGAGEAAPHLDLRRAQLKKQRLGLSFETNDNRIGAEYQKRVVQPRNAQWEREHGAVRVTTVPYGYEGAIW